MGGHCYRMVRVGWNFIERACYEQHLQVKLSYCLWLKTSILLIRIFIFSSCKNKMSTVTLIIWSSPEILSWFVFLTNPQNLALSLNLNYSWSRYIHKLIQHGFTFTNTGTAGTPSCAHKHIHTISLSLLWRIVFQKFPAPNIV